MNYKKIYEELIKNAQKSSRTGYTETHHIIPRCMGGTDDCENLVELTAREHFIAHALLTKFVLNEPYASKLKNAFFAMCNQKRTYQYRYKAKSKIYSMAKRQHSESMRNLHTGKKLSADHILALREGHKKFFSDEEKLKLYVERCSQRQTEERKLQVSEKLKKIVETTDFIKKVSDGVKSYYKTEEGKLNKKIKSIQMKERIKSTDVLNNAKKAIKEKWENMTQEEYDAECERRKTKVTDEFREKMSVISHNNSKETHKLINCEYCEKMISRQNYAKYHGEKCKTVTGISHSQKRVECIHCGKICSPSTLSRWHNDNCKSIASNVIKS